MTKKPNILFYSSKSIYRNNCGGAEIAMNLIAEKLTEKNFQTTYFTNGNSRRPGIKNKIIKGVDVYFFSPWRWPSVRFFETFTSKMVRRQKRKALTHLIQKKHIDLVYTFEAFPDTLDFIKIRKKHNLKFKIVLRMAGLFWRHQVETNRIQPKAIESIFNNIDAMNFLDKGFEPLFKQNCKKYGIHVKNNITKFTHDIGSDCSYYQQRKKTPRNPAFTIICSAKFSKYQKRQDILIEAGRKLTKHGIKIHFAGDGDLLKTYKQKVRDAFPENMIQFHGHIKKHELKKLVENADLVALPTDFEGVSKAIIETMAMGVPVLVSDVPALNSFITNNENGFLVKNQVDAWVETILKLSDNRKLLSEVAENGYHFIQNNFNADQNIHSYVTAFQKI